MTERLRRPGSPWRLLAHTWVGRKGGGKDAGNIYGVSYNIANDSRFGGGDGKDTQWTRHVELGGTEFDELVVGHWIHIEQMDATRWWMTVGGVVLWVDVDRDGRPRKVDVYGPGDYNAPVDGCTYELCWTDPEPSP